MGRYWINIPYTNDILVPDEEKAETQKQLNSELESLGWIHREDLGSCFKVRGLEEAKELASDVLEILRKYEEKEDANLLEVAGVSRQPECPECGRLGRFKDRYCPEDGSEMIPVKNWSLEEFVETEVE